MRKLLPLAFIFILLVSGCISVSPEAIIASSPIVQKFLAQYPNAEIKATFYSEAESAQILDEIRADCEKETVTAKDFYRVTITDPDSGLSITAWLDWNRQLIECAAKKGSSGEKLESYDKEEMEGKKDPYQHHEGYLYKCHEGHVYKFDMDGNKIGKHQYCENGCEDGKCKEEAEVCEYHHYKLGCHEGHVYWFDSCGNRQDKKVYCYGGCEAGRCLDTPEIGECFESDSGFDIYNKGACEVGDQRLEDHCNSDGSLTEKYCEGNEIKAKTTECPAGYVCYGGACVGEGTDGQFSYGGFEVFTPYYAKLTTYEVKHLDEPQVIVRVKASEGKVHHIRSEGNMGLRLKFVDGVWHNAACTGVYVGEISVASLETVYSLDTVYYQMNGKGCTFDLEEDKEYTLDIDFYYYVDDDENNVKIDSGTITLAAEKSDYDCITHSHSGCYIADDGQSDIYWFNSCGIAEEMKEDCPTDCMMNECVENVICEGVLCEDSCMENTLRSGGYCSSVTGECEYTIGTYCEYGCEDGACIEEELNDDIEMKGDLTLRTYCSDWPDCDTDCTQTTRQILVFDVENKFSQTHPYLNFDLFIDDVSVDVGEYTGEYNFIRRLIDNYYAMDNDILPGENQYYIPLRKTLGGHKVKIVIDPENEIDETNEENNFIEKTFPSEKMDISLDHIEYDDFFNQIFIYLRRDKILDECPRFYSDIYVDGTLVRPDDTFFGFNKESNYVGYIWGPELSSPGLYEVRVVIDSYDFIEETNEANNDITEIINISS